MALWPKSGPISANCTEHAAHIIVNRPTYVAVWWEVKDEERLIEVKYVGTHENAPY